MAIYCVSYDLNKPGQKYDNLIDEIKKNYTWWHYLDSTWLLATAESASQISARLRAKIDANDFILVIRVTREYQGWLPQAAWDWLNTNVNW